MKGTLVISVLFKGAGWTPIVEAKKILRHMGKDPDASDTVYTYNITKHVINMPSQGVTKSKPVTIGILVEVDVDDLESAIEKAKTLTTGTHQSYINIDLLISTRLIGMLTGR
jgi:hypothetical protein